MSSHVIGIRERGGGGRGGFFETLNALHFFPALLLCLALLSVTWLY